VERRNQTVVGMARSLLKTMGMPGKFWREAVSTAVYLLNRSPTKSIKGMTPYEAWHGRKPSVHHLRTFGCVAHVKKVGPGLTMLLDRSSQMVFIGYDSRSKAYRFYNPESRKLVVSRDAVFEEERCWDWEGNVTPADCSKPVFTVHYPARKTVSAVAEEKEDFPAVAAEPATPAAPHKAVKTRRAGNGDFVPFVQHLSTPLSATPVQSAPTSSRSSASP
jgi:hypothetical protein